MSIGTDTSTGPGRPASASVPGASQRSAHLVCAANAPCSLHEWLVHRELVGVATQIELLVRSPPLVVGRDVAGDHEQGDGVERRGCDSGHGVRQPGADVQQDDARLARGSRIAIGSMGRHLFVTGGHESWRPGALQGRQHGDVGVAAQTEHDLDAAIHQEGGDVVGDGRLHAAVPSQTTRSDLIAPPAVPHIGTVSA